MSKPIRILLIVLFVPVFLLTFTVVHEVGHTVAARLLGDPNSTFYLAKIDDEGTCLGCNITDHTRLSRSGNMVVSISGLLATQIAAVMALVAARVVPAESLWWRWLSAVGLSFAFLDVIVQGVLYDISGNTWPTGVDLMDFMLLAQQSSGASQEILKAALVIAAAAYLTSVATFHRRTSRRAGLTSGPAISSQPVSAL